MMKQKPRSRKLVTIDVPFETLSKHSTRKTNFVDVDRNVDE